MRVFNRIVNAATSAFFSIFQPDSGTSPTATIPGDTLTLTSSDKSNEVNGNSGSRTIDIRTPASLAVGATTIDWTLANVFYKTISATSALGMTNTVDGKCISLVLTTTGAFGASFLGVTFSGGQPAQASTATTVYSFIRSNGITWGTGV